MHHVYLLILLINKCNSVNTTIDVQMMVWLIHTGTKARKDDEAIPNKYTALYNATGAWVSLPHLIPTKATVQFKNTCYHYITIMLIRMQLYFLLINTYLYTAMMHACKIIAGQWQKFQNSRLTRFLVSYSCKNAPAIYKVMQDPNPTLWCYIMTNSDDASRA